MTDLVDTFETAKTIVVWQLYDRSGGDCTVLTALPLVVWQVYDGYGGHFSDITDSSRKVALVETLLTALPVVVWRIWWPPTGLPMQSAPPGCSPRRCRG